MAELKQFKCLTDLEKLISEIKNLRARPAVRGKHATLYEDRAEGKYRTVMGIRVCDYKFSTDERWVLPDRQMGLSFSASWSNLRFVLGMYAKREKKKPIDVFWVYLKPTYHQAWSLCKMTKSQITIILPSPTK